MTDAVRFVASSVDSPVHELWAELSHSMRILRQKAEMSLRKVEAATGRGRGVLSQIETAKARPNRDLVEWYDSTLGGDGLLISIYAEARTAHGPTTAAARSVPCRPRAGDSIAISGQTLPWGEVVAAGAHQLLAGWTLTNTGSVPWSGRRVRRVGAHGAARLITSAASVPLADCVPGAQVVVRIPFDVPAMTGTFAAHWQHADQDGAACFDAATLLSVVVVSMS